MKLARLTWVVRTGNKSGNDSLTQNVRGSPTKHMVLVKERFYSVQFCSDLQRVCVGRESILHSFT